MSNTIAITVSVAVVIASSRIGGCEGEKDPICTNECLEWGSTTCFDDHTIDICILETDDCYYWDFNRDCSLEERRTACVEGEEGAYCHDPLYEPCNPECSEGTVEDECRDNAVYGCANLDYCWAIGVIEDCSETSQHCATSTITGGQTDTYCTDTCWPEAITRCNGEVVETCQTHSGDLLWIKTDYCSWSGMTCEESGGSASCV